MFALQYREGNYDSLGTAGSTGGTGVDTCAFIFNPALECFLGKLPNKIFTALADLPKLVKVPEEPWPLFEILRMMQKYTQALIIPKTYRYWSKTVNFHWVMTPFNVVAR